MGQVVKNGTCMHIYLCRTSINSRVSYIQAGPGVGSQTPHPLKYINTELVKLLIPAVIR